MSVIVQSCKSYLLFKGVNSCRNTYSGLVLIWPQEELIAYCSTLSSQTLWPTDSRGLRLLWVLFQKYTPCWELSGYSANICVAELCCWCRNDGPQHAAQEEGIITTEGLESFSSTLRTCYNLPFLVNTVMPGKFFCSASSLCGRKLNVSPSNSFRTHGSARVLHNAFWEFFSIPFIPISSLLPLMFAAQGKTKHLNATNTVIIHTVDLDKEETETGVFYAPPLWI